MERYNDPIAVDILGGDRVAGRALELLLQGIGCNARFVAEPVADDTGKWLDHVQLVLIPPTLRPERRDALLASVISTPGTSGVPIIELVDVPRDGKSLDGRYVLLWPCRVEELMQRIKDAVTGRSEEPSAAYG